MTFKTGGNWDKDDRHILWLAANSGALEKGNIPNTHDYFLIAVNELRSEREMDIVEEYIDKGSKVLLDSGIFWLTNKHKRAHNITMDEALSLAPTEIDGWDWLWNNYQKVNKRLGDKVWGYMELDQGGAHNKRITRSKLHDLGINPIPVYHPLNDGDEYFYELAENYDRMCLGNIVQANSSTRLRLLHMLYEKHRKFPDLWVHVLGMNSSEVFHALGIDSADASTWLSPIRWGTFPHQSLLKADAEDLPFDMRPTYSGAENRVLGVNDESRILQMSALSIAHAQRGWRHYANRLREETDLPLYPQLQEKEK